MGAIWFSFRAEMRARWRAALLLTLLVGVTGGVVLAAVAGARRTDSAFTRLVEDTRTEDVLVNPDLGTESALDSRAVERLPQVAVAGRANGYFISPADARSEDDFARYGTILSSAVVTRSALASLGPAFADSSFLIAYRPDATSAEKQRFRSKTADVAAASEDPGNFEVRGVQRPSDIVSYEKVRDTPIVLAALLALLAAATVAHALVTSVRRRRRDFAMLKTLGFTRRQVSAAVAWQASTVGAVALLVGIPLGIVLGRWGWSALADDLGTVAEPIVPVIGVLLAIPVVLALVNLVAFVPGRVAARTQPAVALRSE